MVIHRLSLYVYLLVVVLILAPVAVFAQSSLQGIQGLAEYQKISGTVKDGQIVAIENGKYVLAHDIYNSHLYGVINIQPAVAISQVGRSGASPVITSGSSNILVSTSNGSIAPGDYITSSTEPGIGMKATTAGFVIGVAQGSFKGGKGETGLIPAIVNPTFISSLSNESLSARAFALQFNNVVSVGMRAAASEPNTALRYGFAALVLIISIIFGFLVFGRAATNGVIAVGRNPLARGSIIAVVGFNIIMTVGFSAVGLFLAFLILSL